MTRAAITSAVVALLIVVQNGAAAATIRFAAIGDYGADNANQLAVANLIKTGLQPEFIVTVGDNNYGGASDIDVNIGKYYDEYIGNYTGTYGSGSSSNRFFPALGNHDYHSPGGYAAHLNYFTLPGNERYYDVRRGPVHLFVLNSDSNEPDGITLSSLQAAWLSNQLASSTAPWKLIAFHHPPYSSSRPTPAMRWPFKEWGADAVLAGHAHNYERLLLDDFPYFVNGLGGHSRHEFETVATGSAIRYAAGYGAMQVIATESRITFEFHSIADGGTLIDRFALTRDGSLPSLSISYAPARQQITISWPVGALDFRLESSTNLPAGTWIAVTAPPVEAGGQKVLTLNTSGSRNYYRLRKP